MDSAQPAPSVWQPPDPADLLEVIEHLLSMLARKEAEVAAFLAQRGSESLEEDVERLFLRTHCSSAVMVVSASELTRDLLVRLFERIGASQVVACDDLREAALALNLHPNAIVVADLEGSSSTLEFSELRQLRVAAPSCTILTILPSADPQDFLHAALAGATEVLVKPIDSNRLATLVANLAHATE